MAECGFRNDPREKGSLKSGASFVRPVSVDGAFTLPLLRRDHPLADALSGPMAGNDGESKAGGWCARSNPRHALFDDAEDRVVPLILHPDADGIAGRKERRFRLAAQDRLDRAQFGDAAVA